jgi:hypothetical protein
MSGARPPPRAQQQQAQQDQSGGLIVFSGFSGLNTQASRIGIEDTQAAWMDGWFPQGTDNARIIFDHGAPIFTAPNFINSYQFGNIGATPYCIVFLVDGSVWSVNTITLAAAEIAASGTIQSVNVGMSQWGSTYILIVANQLNGYFVWDGTFFYRSGDTVPGDPGGVMPTGISGTSIETYTGHVWIVNGNVLEFSAPGSIVDFSTANGGGNLTSNDSTLRVRWTQLVATNGYLYLFGDSSITYIANVQTTGAGPSTTTFTIQNADPEVGTPWPGTVDVIGSNIVFANAWGAHVSYGGRTAKISGDLDGIYNSLPNFGGQIPTATKSIVFGKRVWALLLPVIDAFTGQQVNKLFIWDEKRWCSTQQSLNLVYVQHQEIDSVLTAYGTDSLAIYPLFTTPSADFQKVIRSKFWAIPKGDAIENAVNRLWGVVQFHSERDATLTISLDSELGTAPVTVVPRTPFMAWINNVGAQMTWQNNAAVQMFWQSTGQDIVVFPPQACGQHGVLLGFTLTTSAADLGLLSLSTMPVPVQGRY